MIILLYYSTDINLYLELKAKFNSDSFLHLKELMHWGTLQCSCPDYLNENKSFGCLPSQ